MAGLVLETGDLIRAADYVRWMRETPGLDEAVARLGGSDGSPAVIASAIEFVLEGLHLNRRLNKDRVGRRRPLPAVGVDGEQSPIR